MKICLIYVYPNGVWGMPFYSQYVDRFVSTYKSTVCSIPHRLIVMVNGDTHHSQVNPFAGLEAEFISYDDSGWDVGAFIQASRLFKQECHMMLFLTTHAYFTRTGWLARAYQVFREDQQSVYAATASYESNPHVRTAAFWTKPCLMASYPYKVDSQVKRYEFEHGGHSIAWWAGENFMNVRLCTWDRLYDRSEWRSGKDIFRRGNQQNIMIRDRHCDLYDSAPDEEKLRLAAMADGEKVLA